MSVSTDLEYFTRRNRQENEQAKRCLEPSARRAHNMLADLHRQAAKRALAASIPSERKMIIDPARARPLNNQ